MVANPQKKLLLIAIATAFIGSSTAMAQKAPKSKKKVADGKADKAKPKDGDGDAGGKDKGKPKVFDFGALEFEGRLRTPQLIYFLDRAAEELERASLERRSFIPEMVRSIDEEDL